jgi:hypothetical protein
MSTIRDVIKASLDSLGVLAEGETPNADQEEAARLVLNRMLSAWSIDGLLVHAIVREEFTLASGQASRTIGTGGNFDTSRPIRIVQAKLEDQSQTDTPEYPLEVVTTDQWASIVDKAVTSYIPRRIWLDGSYPLNIIYFWPIPSATNKLVLYSEKPLTSFSNVTTSFSFPEGYEEAVVMNLGRKLARSYGKALDQDYLTECEELKGNIRRLNQKPQFMECDQALIGSRFDIIKGW